MVQMNVPFVPKNFFINNYISFGYFNSGFIFLN